MFLKEKRQKEISCFHTSVQVPEDQTNNLSCHTKVLSSVLGFSFDPMHVIPVTLDSDTSLATILLPIAVC